ncbi:Formamidopyrimidine-DNA glycosylase [subsurface metagenome]
MPELPEVETIIRDLEKKVKGKKIKEVIIKERKLIKSPPPEKFKKGLQGRKLIAFERRGKFLIISLDSGKKLVIHLKLTGMLIHCPESRPLLNHTRIIFLFPGKTHLRFNDLRKFGELYLVDSEERIKGIKKLGPEPLGKKFSLSLFQEMLSQKKTKIKPLLMDQKFLAGIGNIYASESLYKAKIHPQRAASALTKEEVGKLYKSLREILKEAIKYRGSSVDSYRDVGGKKGDYEACLKVYGRKGKPCYNCGKPVKRIELGGRGTFFCPNCQR